MNKIYLASKSPRRQMLLKQIGIDFDVIESEIDESVDKNEKPLNYVRRMSINKARAGYLALQQSTRKYDSRPILAADTSIAIGHRILGKPTSRKDAYQMLMALSDKTHQVITCVSACISTCVSTSVSVDSIRENKSVIDNIESINMKTINSITDVCFMKLSNADIENYLETNEWQDKAGSYAIQGAVAKYIKLITGSYSGVVGLPLYETSQLLNSININISINSQQNECEF